MDALIQSLVQSNFAPDRIVPQVSMAQYTTLRIGGPADVLVNVVSADEIAVERGDDAAVGHHAVHVEDKRLGAGYIFFEISHMSSLNNS